MRQSATSITWLAFLAIVPGCALFGRTPVDDSKQIQPREWQMLGREANEIVTHEEPIERKANRQVEETQAQSELHPTAKLLTGPKLALEPLTVGRELEPEANKRPIDPTGIPSFDNILKPFGVKPASAETPPSMQVLDTKGELTAPFALALQFMMDGKHQDAIKVLQAYDEETQEFFIRVGPMLTVFAKTPLSKLSPQEIQTLDEVLSQLRAFLRTRCELLVNRMSYCKEIRGFGDYDALPDNHAFVNATKDRPGEKVQLYVELRNFASVKGDDGMFLTKLACSLELYDSNNQKVRPFPLVFDRKETTYRRSACLNDYHGSFSFYVPQIPPGTYKLTLQVIDETLPNVRRISRKSLDFRVTPAANQTTLK